MLKLLLLLVAAYAGFDLIRTLRTGRARTRITTVTRKHQPVRYWRYVYSGFAVLLFFVAAFGGRRFCRPQRELRCRRERSRAHENGRDKTRNAGGSQDHRTPMNW